MITHDFKKDLQRKTGRSFVFQAVDGLQTNDSIW